MYCLYLFCFGLEEFTLVCKSYYLNGGILFTCASLSKGLCSFMISWRWLGKSLFGAQRLNSEMFWALTLVDGCGGGRDDAGRETARSKAGWSSAGEVRQGECVTIWLIYLLKYQWVTCSRETELLPGVKCKLLQLSVKEQSLTHEVSYPLHIYLLAFVWMWTI